MYTPSTASGRRSRTDPDENCLISYTQYKSQYSSQKKEQIQSAFQIIKEMKENDKRSLRYPQLKIIQATSVISHLLTKYQASKLQTYFWVVRESQIPLNSLDQINDVNLSPAVISRNRRHQIELLRQEQFRKGLKKLDIWFEKKMSQFKFQGFVSTFYYQITNNNSESFIQYQQFATQNEEDERIAIQFAGTTQLINLISTLVTRQKMHMFLCLNTQEKRIPKQISLVDHDSLKLSAICVLNSLFEKKLKTHLLQLKVHSFLFKQRNSTLIVSLKEAAHRKSQILGKIFQSVESELEQFLQSTNYTDSPKNGEEKRDSDLPIDYKKKMSQTVFMPTRKVLSPLNLTSSSYQSSSNSLEKENIQDEIVQKKSKSCLYLLLSQLVLFVVLISIKFI